MTKTYHLPRLYDDSSYINPPAYNNLYHPQTNPDPYVIKYNGMYYCYSTGEGGVQVSISKDLVTWTYLGIATVNESKHNYWAPSVIYDNGIFYLYCSNTSSDTDDCHQEYLQLYTSTKPEGPFTFVKTFFYKFSIDAHVIRDHNGELYLFYSTNDYNGIEENNAGTIILVDRLLSFTELAGEEHAIVLPSLQEEVFEQNRFGDGRDWYTIEGAFFLRRRGHAFLLYAANAYVRENYFLGYSYTDHAGPISDICWRKYPDDYTFSPLVRRNQYVEGTGHCSVIQAPNLVDDWIIYHGRSQKQPLLLDTEQRVMYIDPLFYSGNRLITNAPSFLEQDAPSAPTFSCFGDFSADNSETLTTNDITLIIIKTTLTNYVMECNLISLPTHMGACYGLFLSYLNINTYLKLQFNSGKRTVQILQAEHGLQRVLQEYRLSTDYSHTASHHLRISRFFEKFYIFLDDVLILSLTSSIPYGRTGFFTQYTQAEVLYFAITSHVALYGEDLCYFSKLFQSEQLLLLGIEKNSAHILPDPQAVRTYIRSAAREPSVIRELYAASDSMCSLTCRLLRLSSFLKVEFLEAEQAVLTVLIKNQTLKITNENIDSDCKQTILYDTEYKEREFTLSYCRYADKISVYLDNHYVCIPNAGTTLLKLTTSYLDIIGYEQTQKIENRKS